MPRRKAPEQRQRTNSPDIGRVEPGVSVAVPPLPHPHGRKLLASTAAAWDEFWAGELAQLVNRADLPALGRLFQMYDLRERMQRALLAEPWVAGSTGQIVAHPAAKELASLDGRIVALEDRFGVTPMARLKLGVTFGAAVKSLEDLNREFDRGDDDDAPVVDQGEQDPRLRVIDARSTERTG